MALDMLGRQPSLDVQDYFLPGFDSSLDDRCADPWCPPGSPFEVAGSQPTRHDLVRALERQSVFLLLRQASELCLGGCLAVLNPRATPNPILE
jgi:hypothetical protein